MGIAVKVRKNNMKASPMTMLGMAWGTKARKSRDLCPFTDVRTTIQETTVDSTIVAVGTMINNATVFLTALNMYGSSSRVVYDRIEREPRAVSYTHLRAHETDSYIVCRLML